MPRSVHRAYKIYTPQKIFQNSGPLARIFSSHPKRRSATGRTPQRLECSPALQVHISTLIFTSECWREGHRPQIENATNTSNNHALHLRLQYVWTLQPSSANAGERGASPNEGWRVLARGAQAPNRKTRRILARFPLVSQCRLSTAGPIKEALARGEQAPEGEHLRSLSAP